MTLQSLAKYRQYRFRVVALTNAGEGEPTPWSYTRTLAGSTHTHTHIQEYRQYTFQIVPKIQSKYTTVI